MNSRDFKIICWVLAYGCLPLASRVISSLLPYSQTSSQTVLAVLSAAFCVASTAAIAARGYAPLFALALPRNSQRMGDIGWRAMFCAALLLPMLNVVALLAGLPAAAQGAHAAIVLFAGAYAEELLFRGYMLHALRTRTRMPAIRCVMATSVIFSLLHMANAAGLGAVDASLQAVFALFAGIAFGCITCQSKSILPACTIHMLVNLTSADISAMLLKLLSIAVSGCVAAFAVWVASRCGKAG